MDLRKTGVTLLLVGLALQAGWVLWWETRHWAPVDLPITLSPGHIKTKEFKLNLSGYYDVAIEVQKNIPFDTLNCLLGVRAPTRCGNTQSVIEVTWTLYSGERIVARGPSTTNNDGTAWAQSSISRGLGGFDGKYGKRYTLEASFLKDGSRLASCNPHLRVGWADAKSIVLLSAIISLVAILFWLIGVPLILFSLRGRTKKIVAYTLLSVAALLFIVRLWPFLRLWLFTP